MSFSFISPDSIKWLILVIIIEHVRGGPFYCDEDLEAGPLRSQAYTCDGINQCVDKQDEDGCLECSSGRLLLSGLDNSTPLFQYATIFSKQDYKLENRPVYKAVKGSLILGYIKYNNKRWVLSKGVDGEAIIVSSETTLAEPFVIGISWSTADGVTLVDVKLECVPLDLKKCFGNLLIVTPKQVINLEPTMEYSGDGRATYGNDQYQLEYVDSSVEWSSPHWQVVDITSDIEVIVFLKTSSLYPEFITTPGVFKTEDGQWRKSSNAYVSCDILTASQPHPLDCLFKDDTCGWTVRGDYDLAFGAAEQFSLGSRAPPTAYIHADQPTPGKIRLISPSFDVEKGSCLLLRLASTVLSPNAASPNITVSLRDLYSSDLIYELTKCTNENWSDCSTIEEYKVEKIPINDIRTDATVTISIILGKNEQPSGIVSLAEIALIGTACDDLELEWMDTCYDFDFPCAGASDCISAGVRGYECQCDDPLNQSGPTCEATSKPCDTFIEPEHSENVTALDGFAGSVILVKCNEGYTSNGHIAKCKSDGTLSGSPACIEKECPALNIPHSSTAATRSETVITCDEGYLPQDPQTLTCEKGKYSRPHRDCLLDCSHITKELQGKEIVTLQIQTCDYHTQVSATNYTNCILLTEQMVVPGKVPVSSDVSANVTEAGKICARYAGVEDGVCSEKCAKSGVLKIIRTLQNGKQQSIQLETNFDYTRGKLVSSHQPNSVHVRLVSIGLIIILFT